MATRRRPGSTPIVPAQDISRAILLLRGQRVILDAELVALYGGATQRLNQQVRRNRERFPPTSSWRSPPRSSPT